MVSNSILITSFSEIPSISAHSIQIISMASAISKRFQFVKLILPSHKKHNSEEINKIKKKYDFNSAVQISYINISKKYYLGHIKYLLGLLWEIIKLNPDIIYGRYLYGSLLGLICNKSIYFESHYPNFNNSFF